MSYFKNLVRFPQIFQAHRDSFFRILVDNTRLDNLAKPFEKDFLDMAHHIRVDHLRIWVAQAKNALQLKFYICDC